MEWKKMFPNYLFGKEVIYNPENIRNLNQQRARTHTSKQANPILKYATCLIDIFSKGDIQMANKYIKDV